MGGMMGMQQGTALSGDIVGGIGSLIAAENYKRPKLPPAVGPELRLRQLAQDQLLGGGQQLLGATALYNQLAPILMGQLPGMHYVPPSATGGMAGAGTDMGGGGGGQPGGATTSPISSYAQTLQNYQGIQALMQQQIAMRKQLKGMTAGPAKHALRQQLQGVNRAIKSQPTTAQRERQMYMAGSQPGSFDIRMQQPAGAPPPPSPGSSLGDINALMGSLNQRPDLSSLYQNPYAGGGGY